MKVKDSLITLLKMIGMVVAASIVGMLLLWIVYFLPVEPMAKNVAESYHTLKALDDSQYLLHQDFWKAYDRGTNIIMLHEIIYPDTGNELRDALLVPTADYIEYWTADWSEVLHDYASNRQYAEGEYDSYARYWHGYLVYLKPLFLFMNLQDVNTLNAFVVAFLIILTACLMYKRLGVVCIAYLLTIAVMNPINIALSFQLSTVFYAMQITLILLLLKDNWEKEHLLFIFVLDGILLSYLDFLTYPFVAFGLPALTCYFLYKDKKILDNFMSLIFRGIAFAIGYGGMWGMKWILASLLTEENVILDAVNSVLHRTGVTQTDDDASFMSISAKDALERNLSSFFNEQNIIILCLVLVLAIGFIVFTKKRFVLDKQNILFCMMMSVAPFLWIVLLTNHCSLHPHLEWRTFAVLVYALSVLIISSIKMQEEMKRNDIS
mgnify:CR=1 FL=1